MAEDVLYPRFIERRLAEALEDSPVVLIQGPRQCGKTTLAQLVGTSEYSSERNRSSSLRSGRDADYTYFSFDNEVIRAGAEADPLGFVAELPDRVILDEVQRVPALFAALKLEVDRRRLPGRFLLTGSSNVLQTPALSDSLAGRMETVRLHPLAQCELQRGPDSSHNRDWPPGFLDALFGRGFESRHTERLGKELMERIVSGGYPAALMRPVGRRRANWYRNYLNAQMERDIPEISRIRSLDVLPRLLRHAAVQTATLFNLSELAAPFQVSRTTIRDYVTLLERVFLLEQLPPWHSNRLKRLIKTPKLHLGDTGLACALLGVDAADLMADRIVLGKLLETFAYQELRRQASWHADPVSFYHFRDRDGAEVDVVLERGTRALAGVEIKAGATVTTADFRALRKLKAAAGIRFSCGVVLYDGETSVRFDDGLYAVPLRLLWELP
ncbi:MAG: ATP-binding protein [Caldilineaceae bacterium]|nr:ATP-binding protein [Caldilineaceae bacterium]